jgi:archaemetzincin
VAEIDLVRVGLSTPGDAPELETLDALAAGLARTLRMSCHVRTDVLDASFAFSEQRNQFHSTAILQAMNVDAKGGKVRLLGIAAHDLYVPVLTFVFGEAQLNGPCALVSMHRLREEFYGLAAKQDILRQRLLKEAVHELGHTFGLRHCRDWRCAMASTHAVERLDLKEPFFCRECAQKLSTT